MTQINPSEITIFAVDDFREWIDREGRSLVISLNLCQQRQEAERLRVESYVMPIFNRYKFPVKKSEYKRHGSYVDKPENIYLCDDPSLVEAYQEEVETAHDETKPGFVENDYQRFITSGAETLRAEDRLLFSLREIGLLRNCGETSFAMAYNTPIRNPVSSAIVRNEAIRLLTVAIAVIDEGMQTQ